MSDVAAYHVLFPVQEVCGLAQPVHIPPALETTHTHIRDTLPRHS